MSKLIPMIKSDFFKIKNTPFWWIHICAPLVGIIMFLGYYSFASWSAASKIQGYLQAVSMAFPIMIGIVASIVIEQEAMAGRFKEMLASINGKHLSLLSKVAVLLLSGLISTILAVGGFAFGFEVILHQNVLPIVFYGYIILIIFGSQIFLYLLHICLSLLWGNGASIGAGIFESLFSALIITGLGDGIWQWIPCGWAIRFCDYFLMKWNRHAGSFSQLSDFNGGIKNCIIFTALFGIFLGVWFNYYEGRKEK